MKEIIPPMQATIKIISRAFFKELCLMLSSHSTETQAITVKRRQSFIAIFRGDFMM
jgi:hypothetical protein